MLLTLGVSVRVGENTFKLQMWMNAPVEAIIVTHGHCVRIRLVFLPAPASTAMPEMAETTVQVRYSCTLCVCVCLCGCEKNEK